MAVTESPEERVVRILSGVRRFRYKHWDQTPGRYGAVEYLEVTNYQLCHVYTDGSRWNIGDESKGALDRVLADPDWYEL